MVDLYANYAALAAGQVEGVDYLRQVSYYPGAVWSSVAIHGGGIEPGSGEMAQAVAFTRSSLYVFAGIKTTGNVDLHLTSTNFDEPMGLALIASTRKTLSFHGFAGTVGVKQTAIGGLDLPTVALLTQRLTAAGFAVITTPSEIAGTDPLNFCNRNASGAGVQLELSLAQREAFFPGGDTSRTMRDSGVRTPEFWAYVDAVRSVTSLDAALNSSSVTYTEPTVTALWAGLLPGYAGSVSPLDALTDLSQQIGPEGLSVKHSLDDGLPDPVTLTTGNDAAGVLEAGLVGRNENRADVWGRTVTTGGVGTGTVITGTLPSDVSFGDYVIVAVAVNSLATVTPQSDWALLGSVGDVSVETLVYGRQHYDGAAAFSAVLGASGNYAWACVGFYASTASGTLVDVVPGTAAVLAEPASVTSHTVPAVSLTGRGWVISVWGRNAAGNTFAPTGTDVEVIEQSGGSTSVAIESSPFYDTATTRDFTVTTSAATAILAAVSIPMRIADRPKMDAKQYFSPFNKASPIRTLDRDVAVVTANANIITDNGVTPTQIFTGQMQDIPVTGRKATLQAVSKTRIRMNRSVSIPMVSSRRESCTMDWLATWLAAQGSQFAGAAPSRYTRYWAPLYGSLHAHYDSPYGYNAAFVFTAGPSPQGVSYPAVVPGPILTGMYAEQTSTRTIELVLNPAKQLYQESPDAFPHINEQYGGLDLQDVISKANSKGRVSFWIRADAAQDAPAYLAVGNSYLWEMKIQVNDRAGAFLGYVRCAIDTNIRRGYISMGSDAAGIGTVTYSASGLLPSDGSWRFVSFWWDFAAGEARFFHNGVESNSNFWATSGFNATAQLPATDEEARRSFAVQNVTIRAHVPISDLMYEAGIPYSSGFWDDQYLGNGPQGKSMITRSVNRNLGALAEPIAVNAWDTLAELAKAALAAYRINELDNLEFLPLGYFGETPQMTVSSTLDTLTNAGELEVSQDPSKIRNVVTVQFVDTKIDSTRQTVMVLSSALQIPRGTTFVTFPLDVPIVEIHGASAGMGFATLNLTNLSSATIAAGTVPATEHYICINLAQDGTGVYQTAANVAARIVAADTATVTVRFVNLLTVPVWVTNNGDSIPFMRILGYGVRRNDGYSTQRDDASVARRGERGLDTQLVWIHSRADAEDVASTLAGLLSSPRPEVTVEVVGDPRRTPGQLVEMADAEGTAAAGNWRTLSVEHNLVGAQYTQVLGLVQVMPEAVWDGPDGWDDAVWSA